MFGVYNKTKKIKIVDWNLIWLCNYFDKLELFFIPSYETLSSKYISPVIMQKGNNITFDPSYFLGWVVMHYIMHLIYDRSD